MKAGYKIKVGKAFAMCAGLACATGGIVILGKKKSKEQEA